MAAPSAIVSPVRLEQKGRHHSVDTMRSELKPANADSERTSAPPANMTVACPVRMASHAYGRDRTDGTTKPQSLGNLIHGCRNECNIDERVIKHLAFVVLAKKRIQLATARAGQAEPDRP